MAQATFCLDTDGLAQLSAIAPAGAVALRRLGRGVRIVLRGRRGRRSQSADASTSRARASYTVSGSLVEVVVAVPSTGSHSVDPATW